MTRTPGRCVRTQATQASISSRSRDGLKQVIAASGSGTRSTRATAPMAGRPAGTSTAAAWVATNCT
jgi:hypothetical protein